MDFVDIYLAQLQDPFRIGLLVAMVLTAANTANNLNRWIPIALGTVFVAILLPNMMPAEGATNLMNTLVGIVSNATIVAVLLGLQLIYWRVTR